MIDMKRSDPISFKNTPIEIGSLGFWGVGLGSSDGFVSLCSWEFDAIAPDAFFWEAFRISERRDECGFFSPSSGGEEGVSLIEK